VKALKQNLCCHC